MSLEMVCKSYTNYTKISPARSITHYARVGLREAPMSRRNFMLNSLHAGFLCLCLFSSVAAAQGDPLALQQQAIQRIDAFVEYFRKTGDLQSRVPDLAQAEAELAASNSMLAARGDWPALALGLIK